MEQSIQQQLTIKLSRSVYGQSIGYYNDFDFFFFIELTSTMSFFTIFTESKSTISFLLKELKVQAHSITFIEPRALGQDLTCMMGGAEPEDGRVERH